MSVRVLHRYLKRRCGLSSPIISKKTGEIIEWDDESISFENMPESERAAYIDQALETLSKWIGCDVTQLRSRGTSTVRRSGMIHPLDASPGAAGRMKHARISAADIAPRQGSGGRGGAVPEGSGEAPGREPEAGVYGARNA
jgi:hypothetical protein